MASFSREYSKEFNKWSLIDSIRIQYRIQYNKRVYYSIDESFFACFLWIYLFLFRNDLVYELVEKSFREIFVLVVDLPNLVFFLLFLLFFYHPHFLLKIHLSPQFLRFLKSPFQSPFKILHTLDLPFPILIHSLILISYLSDQSKGQLQNVKSSFLRPHCQYILIAFMEFHWRYSDGTYWVLDCPFMRLVHKVPNVDRSVRFSDETNSCSAGTPTACSMKAALRDQTTKNRSLNITKYTLILFFQILKWKS